MSARKYKESLVPGESTPHYVKKALEANADTCGLEICVYDPANKKICKLVTAKDHRLVVRYGIKFLQGILRDWENEDR